MKTCIKKIRVFLIYAFISTFLFSCTKDDPTPDELLTGTWNSGIITIVPSIGTMPLAIWLNANMGISSTEALLYTTMFSTLAQSYFSGTLEFRSDKTFTWTMTSGSESGTWSLSPDGKKLTLTSTASVISISDETDVSELTESTLKLHISASVKQDITNDGKPEEINIAADLSFNKKE